MPVREGSTHSGRDHPSVLLPQPEVLPAAGWALVAPGPLRLHGRRHTFPHAKVLGHRLPALLTLDCTAPVELTVTTGHQLRPALLHRQTAVPAQPPAAPLLPLGQVLALADALAALHAGQAQRAVLQAVVRGVLQVHQLLAGDGVESLADGPAAGGTVAGAL